MRDWTRRLRFVFAVLSLMAGPKVAGADVVLTLNFQGDGFGPSPWGPLTLSWNSVAPDIAWSSTDQRMVKAFTMLEHGDFRDDITSFSAQFQGDVLLGASISATRKFSTGPVASESYFADVRGSNDAAHPPQTGSEYVYDLGNVYYFARVPTVPAAAAYGSFGTWKGTLATPEPSTLISGLTAGLMGLGYAWRRRAVTT